MALSCASMAANVQAQCGRTDDNVLITTNQIMAWFHEAQADIVDRVPGLHAMTFKNTASIDITEVLRYAIADITAGDYTTQAVASLWNVYYMDGQDSKRLDFVHTDEWDANWLDPTHSDSPFGKPHHWTRRGQYVEIRPVCSCSYVNHDLRFDGDFYARDWTASDSTRYSDLSQAEEGLQAYALSKAWRAIGSIGGVQGALVKAVDYSQQYMMWLDGYEQRNNRLNEWDGNVYSDSIG